MGFFSERKDFREFIFSLMAMWALGDVVGVAPSSARFAKKVRL